jgi:ATP synthase protein I
MDDNKLPSLEKLDKAIKEAKKHAEGDEEKEITGPAGIMRISVDLVAGVVVGTVSGIYLDKWLGTKPVFFLICFFLGIAGSVLNIYRAIKKDNKEE